MKSPIAKYIYNNSNSLLDFWSLSHTTRNSRWLTGSSSKSELDFLKFIPNTEKYDKILVVGVGKGFTSNYIAKLGFEVQVLDITKSAFKHLDKRILKKHLATNYQTLSGEKFDIVLHHLVAQHMSEPDLIEQLGVLLKCLKPNGEIRMQIASAIDPLNNSVNYSFEDQKAGSILRDPGKLVNDLFVLFNTETVIDNVLDFPNWENGWRWFLLVIKNSNLNSNSNK